MECSCSLLKIKEHTAIGFSNADTFLEAAECLNSVVPSLQSTSSESLIIYLQSFFFLKDLVGLGSAANSFKKEKP
jgi:hypothetical protein